MAKKPRQMDIPGTEDTAIKELEDVASDYAELRDERIALLEKEVELKKKLLTIMKRHNKTEYLRDGISVRVVPEGEKIKVKIKPPKEEAEAV